MKMDNVTVGAVIFAAFAAWAYLKPGAAKAATGKTPAQVFNDTLKSQREQVGAATYTNFDPFGYKDSSYQPPLASMGGGTGLYAPSAGFWSV